MNNSDYKLHIATEDMWILRNIHASNFNIDAKYFDMDTLLRMYQLREAVVWATARNGNQCLVYCINNPKMECLKTCKPDYR